MVNSGNVLLRRPQHASPVHIRQPAGSGGVNVCDGSSDSGEERTRTPSPVPSPPTNFDSIIKSLEQVAIRDKNDNEIKIKTSGEEPEEVSQNYIAGLPVLDKLARHYILNAFFVDMGWTPKLGEILNVDSLVADFKLDRHHQYLIGTLLVRLEESGIVARLPEQPGDDLLDFSWKVTGLPPNATSIRQSLKELQTELVLEHGALGPELNFLNHVGPQLYDCIRGRANAREVLWPSKESPDYKHSLLPYYENSLRVQEGQVAYLKEAVGKFVLALAADAVNRSEVEATPAQEQELIDAGAPEVPLLRILEIGASGSCAAAIPIIHHLVSVYDNNTSSFPASALTKIVYTYSDSSSIALGKAKSVLESEFPDIKFEFKVLDLESEPPAETKAEYDIILALNALHTAKYLDDSLRHLRMLLKSGGMLAIGELFSPDLFLEATLGVSEGWWRWADRIRSHGPLLSGMEWEAVLGQFGFVHTYAYGGSEKHGQHQNGKIATAGARDASFGVVLATGNNNNDN